MYITIEEVDGLLLVNKEPPFCEGCLFGKAKWSPFPKKDVKIIATKIGDIVHNNLCGPFNSKSMGGASYDISLKYDHS